nr:unnamed protein product [Digitaria exilis]
MFRNKVLVRAAADSSSTPLPPFRLRQLSLSAAAPIPALDLEILCCRLSRRHRLACLPQPPADALLVFQRCQSREAAEAVSEVVAAFPGSSVGEEEALECSGELVAKAVGCELRSMMLEHGWRCLGESIYVDSEFDQNEERTDQCAVNVEVRLGRNNDFEFVISPDAFQFTTHKISDVASSNMMEAFQHGNEVFLDTCSFLTVCTTLPTLQEGHVFGYSKMLPSEQWLDRFPSSLVLQGPGLQPALKSVRLSKAMAALQSFVELLKVWSFFGHNKLLIKEQVLLTCSSTLPTWNNASSNLTSHSSRTDNIEDLDLGHTEITSKVQSFILDFRTPKPAVLCSWKAKLWNTEVHISHSLGDNDNLSGTRSINDGFQSQLLRPNVSHKSQVTLFKPSFSRSKPSEKMKLRFSSEHHDAENSNKSRHHHAVEDHPNPVSSSSAILDMPVIQVSENHGRKQASLITGSCQGGVGIAKESSMVASSAGLTLKCHLTFLHSKDYTPGIQVTKEVSDIEKDLLTTKVINTKLKTVVAKDVVTAEAKRKATQDLEKNALTAMTKQKTMPELVKNEFFTKNDGLNKKVTKAKAKTADKDPSNSTRTKAKPDVANDELIAKVIDNHRRGELRLLTVADLKCFLSAKKAKVGGTKEVLIKRVTELLA